MPPEEHAMNAQEVLATLKKRGKPQTAAIYKRHGSGDNVFGVLTSEIAQLQKTIKVDHPLAKALWRTKNAEARVLALQVADPAKLTRTDADGLVKDGPVRFIGCYLSGLVARSPIADRTMRAWMRSPDESSREMGYGVLGVRLKDDPDSISDADAAEILETIEKEIHRSPNWARYAMNGALIAIGVYKPALRTKAIAAAGRIGKVEVDHGETNCKTPDAAPYIEKALKRKRRP
jgi:3-methyladenine DNA glycosylase AlkD